MRKRGKVVRNCIFVLLLLTVLLGLFALLFVKQNVKAVTIEAGDNLSVMPESYFQASPVAMKLIQLESSAPDTRQPQNTKLIYSVYGVLKKTVSVEIVDQTPPDLELYDVEMGYAPGTVLAVDDLTKACTDNAYGTPRVFFEDGSDEQLLDTVGTYSYSIVAVDDSGNDTKMTVTVNVANPPAIFAPSAYFVIKRDEQVGTGQLARYIRAMDEKDGDLADDQLELKINGFDGTEEGEYGLTIVAENSSHVKATTQIPIVCADETTMTERMLEKADRIPSSIVLDEDDGKQAERLLGASLSDAEKIGNAGAVSIHYALGGGKFAYGNGVVLDIDGDDLYIASNYHVVGTYNEYPGRLMFANGSMLENYTFVGGDEQADIGFLKIDMKELDEETRQLLAEPRISLARSKSITSGESVFRSSLYQQKKPETVQGLFNTYDITIFNGQRYSSFDVDMKQGDSGSGIYDEYGFLISVCCGISYESGRQIRCGVRMEDIISEFQKQTGHSLYAY